MAANASAYINSLMGNPIDDKSSMCLLCSTPTKLLTKNLMRHYHRKHKSSLNSIRPQTRLYKSTITTAEDYQQNIVNIMATTNLPFNFWSNKFVRDNQQGFTDELGVSCSSRAMSKWLSMQSTVDRKKIGKELTGRLISIKFDTAIPECLGRSLA